MQTAAMVAAAPRRMGPIIRGTRMSQERDRSQSSRFCFSLMTPAGERARRITGEARRIAPTPMTIQRVTGWARASETWKRRERVSSSTGDSSELRGDADQAAQTCDDATGGDEGQNRRGGAPGRARAPV